MKKKVDKYVRIAYNIYTRSKNVKLNKETIL